mgnify:CR=1 FL=1
MHSMVYHVPEFMRRYSIVKQFTGQGKSVGIRKIPIDKCIKTDNALLYHNVKHNSIHNANNGNILCKLD